MSTIWIICQYAMSPESGGYLRQHFLARELARAGHDVYVIAARVNHMMTHPEAKCAAPFQEPGDGYTMVRLDTIAYPHAHHKKRILGWMQFGWQLPNLMRRGLPKPDAVLYSSPNLLSFLGAERAARKAGARLVFEVRDIWPLTLTHIGNINPRHPFMRLLQWIEDRAYRVSDAVISTLPNAHEHMVSRGMDRAKFHWIPNGADLGDDEMRQALDPDVAAQLPRDRFLVGYVGTLGEANYLDPVLDAAALLKERTDIALVIVGGGRCKQALQARAAAEGLVNVTFIDPIPKPQVQSMLACFDACVLSMLHSPLYRFGVSLNKLTDYFVAARPVIYAAETGAYNPVHAHQAGLSIPPGDAEAFAEAVTQLQALSAKERAAMGQRGLACISSEYDYTRLGTLLETILLSK
jgi:glycosyltransferase involved in cell wall biosynthesis